MEICPWVSAQDIMQPEVVMYFYKCKINPLTHKIG